MSSTQIPLISYVASAAQALPLVASLKYRGALQPARRWIVVWAFALLLTDALGLWYSKHGAVNLWIGYCVRPVALGLVLMALSYWQPSSWARALYRLAIPFFLAVLVVVSLLVEDRNTYSLITGPFENLILFAASLATVLAGAWRLEGSLWKQDWFWVGIGLALTYGTGAAFDPIARVLVGRDSASLVTIHVVAAWIDLIVYVLIARGMLCPIPPLRTSSGPMSSASSPSSSSSPLSAPPW